MVNFVVAIAVAIGLFIGVFIVSNSFWISLLSALAGLVVSLFAVGLYMGQRKQQIQKQEEVPLETQRTPENTNPDQDYNPAPKNEKRIEDPTN